MIDGYTIITIVLLLLLAKLVHVHTTGDSYRFWTAGPIRRAIFEQAKRIIYWFENL